MYHYDDFDRTLVAERVAHPGEEEQERREAEEEDEDAGYFPSYVEYMDEEEFLEDAYDMLKVGIAEFELDREQRSS